MPSNTSRTQSSVPDKRATAPTQNALRNAKPVQGVVVARRLLTPEERAVAQARAANSQVAAKAAGPVAVRPPQSSPKAAASSAASSRSSEAAGRLKRQAGVALKHIGRAVLTRSCAICGAPITGKALQVNVGPLLVEVHAGCANPVRRVQHAIDWINSVFAPTGRK